MEYQSLFYGNIINQALLIHAHLKAYFIGVCVGVGGGGSCGGGGGGGVNKLNMNILSYAVFIQRVVKV